MELIARVWEVPEQTGVGMLTTQFGGGVRARPLDARPDRLSGVIYFVTDVRGLKDDEIAACPDVCFVVADACDKIYLSITGRAHVLQAPMLAAKIWKKADDVRWPDGPQDQHVRVLCLEPATGRVVGRTGQLGRRQARIRQCARHWREAEPGREP